MTAEDERIQRKLDLQKRIGRVIAAAKEASRPNDGEDANLSGRELALAVTKLEEAEMWAARIPV